MATIRSRPDNVNVSTRHSPPDNVLVEGNGSTVPPYPSSFLIQHRAIHTLATYQWGALPSSRGDVFAAIFSLLRIQSPTRQRLLGRSSCGRHSIHRANSATGPWTHRGQRRDIVGGQEIMQWQVASSAWMSSCHAQFSYYLRSS